MGGVGIMLFSPFGKRAILVPARMVVKQALAAYVDREAERYRMTVEAMADVDAGNGLSHQGVKAWAAALSPDKPLQLSE